MHNSNKHPDNQANVNGTIMPPAYFKEQLSTHFSKMCSNMFLPFNFVEKPELKEMLNFVGGVWYVRS